MSDDSRRVDPVEGKPTPAPPRPRPGGPSATSRARRIGGGAPLAPRAAVPPATDTPPPPPADTSGDSSPSGAKSSRWSLRKDAPDVADVAPVPPDSSADEPGKARRGPVLPAWTAWIPAAALVVAAVVLAALLVVNRVGGNSAPATTGAKLRQTVLAAAKSCVVDTNSYKYTDIDGAKAKALACATGRYASNYANAMDTIVKPNSSTLKMTQTAQVNVAGIESVSKTGTQWGILVYGQLNIVSTTTGPKGRIDPFALVATMQQVKGKWVIANIKSVSSTSG